MIMVPESDIIFMTDFSSNLDSNFGSDSNDLRYIYIYIIISNPDFQWILSNGSSNDQLNKKKKYVAGMEATML